MGKSLCDVFTYGAENSSKVLYMWPRAVEKNDVGFNVVMVGSPNLVTKRNPYHFLKVLVVGYSVKM